MMYVSIHCVTTEPMATPGGRETVQTSPAPDQAREGTQEAKFRHQDPERVEGIRRVLDVPHQAVRK